MSRQTWMAGWAVAVVSAFGSSVVRAEGDNAATAPAASAAPQKAAAPAAKAPGKTEVSAPGKAEPSAPAKSGATAPGAPESTNAKGGTVVEFKTTEGSFKIELADKEAPISTKNFLAYVNDKFYDGTVFHRVIDGFVIQGGGFKADGGHLKEQPTRPSIANEAKNGLKNDRGSLAMARTMDPNSATAQFYINLRDNEGLNYPKPDGHGYAVFGKIVAGLDVIEKIGKTKTGVRNGMPDVPVADVKVVSAVVVKPGAH